MTDLYGIFVTDDDVRSAVVAHMKVWSDTYIAEVGRQKAADLPGFRGYPSSAISDTYPICVAACGGAESPERHGDGTVTATFGVAVGAVVSAPTFGEAETLAGYYGAAVRAAITQHPSLGGFATASWWDGSTPQEINSNMDRVVFVSIQRFFVIVDDVINVRGGPATPPDSPIAVPAPNPTVLTVDIRTPRI